MNAGLRWDRYHYRQRQRERREELKAQRLRLLLGEWKQAAAFNAQELLAMFVDDYIFCHISASAY